MLYGFRRIPLVVTENNLDFPTQESPLGVYLIDRHFNRLPVRTRERGGDPAVRVNFPDLNRCLSERW